MAIKISGSTIIDDSRQLVNVGVITAKAFSGAIVAGAGTSNIVAGIVTATSFNGTATNATNVAITDDTSGSGTHYIHFGSETSSNDGVEVDSTGLVYKDGKIGIGSALPTLGLDINQGANSGVFLGNPTHGYKVRANVTSSNDYGLVI